VKVQFLSFRISALGKGEYLQVTFGLCPRKESQIFMHGKLGGLRSPTEAESLDRHNMINRLVMKLRLWKALHLMIHVVE
jgi:hypothetical protein